MKKILTTLFLIGLVLPVFAAAQWKELKNNGKSFYVDSASVLQQNTSTYLFWIKQQKSNSIYVKTLMAIDCSNNTGAIQKIITYTNNKVTNVSNSSQSFSYIVPDSDSSIAYDYICGLHTANIKQQKAAEQKAIEQQKSREAAQNLLNTGLGVGLYFLGK